MNRKTGMYASLVNACCVAGFALCLFCGFVPGSYFICMFIAFSFVPVICAFGHYSADEHKTAGHTAMVFAGVYAVFILLVYYAQLTAVRNDGLNEQAMQIIDYQKYGLFFSYDLLGYGLMALSTFFAGLGVVPQTRPEKALKILLMVHGVFFITCLLLPMLGLFGPGMQGAGWIGTAVLIFWCAYFTPVGILSFLYFKNRAGEKNRRE